MVRSLRIFLHVSTNSKSNSIEKVGDAEYKVRVTAKAIHGKANEAVIELLSKYFKVKKSDVKIASGLSNRSKTVEISSSSDRHAT